MKISFDVNNKGILTLEQQEHDGEVLLCRIDNNHITSHETINAGDFVTILNWYRYQKDIGNDRLEF